MEYIQQQFLTKLFVTVSSVFPLTDTKLSYKSTSTITAFKKVYFPNMPDLNQEPIDELDRLTSSVRKTTKQQLHDSIVQLLMHYTGVPVSALIPLLQPSCPDIQEEINPDSTFLHETLMDLLCAKLLNWETWFIDENISEHYILACPALHNLDLVRSSNQLSHQILPKTNTFEALICTNNIDSKHFFFKISNSENKMALEDLVNSMQRVYGGTDTSSNSVPPLLPTLSPGVLCAVNHRNHWHRGRIVSVDLLGVNVELVDYGDSILVALPTANLRILIDQFRSLPRSVIRASFTSMLMTSEQIEQIQSLSNSQKVWTVSEQKGDNLNYSTTFTSHEQSFFGNVVKELDNRMSSSILLNFIRVFHS